MTAQFPLPGHWPDNVSRRNPITILEEIERDKIEVMSHPTVDEVTGSYVDGINRHRG